MILVLFGPPGAGKGTQSELLCKKLNLRHISTGDLLRQSVASGSQLGREAKKYMEKGALVPDSVVIGLIKEALSDKNQQGFLFDGFPRNQEQAKVLDELLQSTGLQVDRAIFLEVPRDLLADRMLGRRVCQNCGATYHSKLSPPKVDAVCDRCGGNVVQRTDDSESVIFNRIDVYEKNTAPLREYYNSQGKLRAVDGVGDPTAVTKRITSAF